MIIDTMFASSGPAVSDTRNPRNWLLNWGGRRTAAGVNVSPDSAMTLSTYFGCLRAISEDVGKLPLKVYERLEPRGKREAPEHAMYRLLHSTPNDEMASMTFRETLTHWALGWGNGYAEIERNGKGEPVAMWPIHPSRVQIGRDDGGRIVYRVTVDDANIRDAKGRRLGHTTLPSRDVFHLHGLGSGNSGYSIAQLARESLGLSLAAQTYGASYFGNDLGIGVVLKHPGALKDDAYKRLREAWKEQHSGPENAGKPTILEEGMEVKRMDVPAKDAQFLETRTFQVEDVCRWFRVPPHKVQHLLRSTFSNIESQNIEYVTDTLMAWLTRWEQEIERKLMPADTGYLAEHLLTALLRGDQAARSGFYKELFGIGVLSQNDIRALENMNPIEDGDTYYVPTNNLSPSGEASGGESDDAESTASDRAPRTVHAKKATSRVFASAGDRLVAKEANAAKRAAKRHAADATAFVQWADEFYHAHERSFVEGFTPAAETLMDLMLADAGQAMTSDAAAAVGVMLSTEAAQLAGAGRQELIAAYQGGQVDAWASERTRTHAPYLAERLTETTAAMAITVAEEQTHEARA